MISIRISPFWKNKKSRYTKPTATALAARFMYLPWGNIYDIQFDLMLSQTNVRVKTRQRKMSKRGAAAGASDPNGALLYGASPYVRSARLNGSDNRMSEPFSVAALRQGTAFPAPPAAATFLDIVLCKQGICNHRCEKWRFPLRQEISILLVGDTAPKPIERRFSSAAAHRPGAF